MLFAGEATQLLLLLGWCEVSKRSAGGRDGHAWTGSGEYATLDWRARICVFNGERGFFVAL
jgi:hypothetical protein